MCASLTERLFYAERGMYIAEFRKQVRREDGPVASPFARLVSRAYSQCEQAETRMKEMAGQTQSALTAYRVSLTEGHKLPYADSVRSAMNQLTLLTVTFEVAFEALRDALHIYGQEQGERAK
jgi:hypothetical protein